MAEDVVALIPVREGSQRIKDKNFKPFADEKSLLHLKIRQLKEADCFKAIYISSDSEKARAVAKEEGVDFLERGERYCRSDVRWDEVTDHILETIPGNPIVAWTMTTAPMFRGYKKALAAWSEKGDAYDSILTVLKSREYLLDAKGRPLNCNFGFWHSYTGELDPHFVITGSLYAARKSDQLKWHYWIGTKPMLYEISKFECVDVDYEDDFSFAEFLHRARGHEPASG